MSERVAECAECGRTAPLTSTGNGTPAGWAYVADEQVTYCPLHRFHPSTEWQDFVQTYSRAELAEKYGKDHKAPPEGSFEDE